ncbi:hypothetical protein [Brachybacterium sp. J153]|uniref:hypothetical protein n=1 Tax=Brachybacterium sp. J153 TaxID=3116488 RepID=UPI002E78877D|nr:hypothetical protein [Brachybacterium sp. J153]MEE1619376.1 hypothetical protein [Brachybacterium sp. J153]
MPARPFPHVLRAVLLALLGALLLVPSSAAARADAPETTDAPVRLVIATAGLTWEDIDAERTPTLQCLADRAGVGAMNTTSTTVVSTKRQGLETLRTGYRGLAEEAPRTSGIPTPPTDQWQQLPVDVTSTDDPAAVAGALADGDLVELLAPSIPDHDDPARAEALTALDGTVAAALEDLGGCAAADLPRTLLVSVAATDPAHPEEVERTGAVASRTVGLQVAMDTGLTGQALTSGATKQTGVVVLTDVLATILDSHGASPEGLIPGQPFRGADHADPQQLAWDRSEAGRLVDAATLPALGSWLALGVVGLVIVLVPALARRPRLAAAGRALAAIAPLALPVGLCASLVPWWRAEHPTLALAGVVWGGCALLSVLVLGGPWRRSRFGPAGVSAALIAGIVLLESATGSRLQLSSPLGAQPISGGRFYGLSNHLFGLVLAAALMALLCLFTVVRSPRARVLWTVGVGLVTAAVCVAPSMGADFGSGLATIPAFGLLALLVSGIRLRVWHVLALGAGGAAAVLSVSFLDWLRPPEDRTHLGRFIDELLSGELVSVVVRKLAQNVAMATGYWALAVVLVLAVLASVAILLPGRIRWRRLAALDAAHPVAHRVRIALVVGAWVGYAVNDTGPVLVAAMLGVWLVLLPAVLPDPERV